LQKLSDIPQFTIRFWTSLGNRLINSIRDRVKNKHANVRGQHFKPYSVSYMLRKTKDKAAPKNEHQLSRSALPDMTLTGETLKDLQIREVTKKSVTFGWQGMFAEVVGWLDKKKNYKIVGLTGDVLSKKEMKIIDDAFDKDLNDKIEKYAREDIKINIKIEL